MFCITYQIHSIDSSANPLLSFTLTDGDQGGFNNIVCNNYSQLQLYILLKAIVIKVVVVVVVIWIIVIEYSSKLKSIEINIHKVNGQVAI